MIHLWFIHIVKSVSDLGPQGFWGSGENGYLFSGSWGALVIIFRDLGSKFIVWGIWGALQRSKKNLTLKEKPSFCLIISKKNPWISKCIYFPANMLIWMVLMTDMANIFYYRGKFNLKLLIFRLMITYLGTLRMCCIAPF